MSALQVSLMLNIVLLLIVIVLLLIIYSMSRQNSKALEKSFPAEVQGLLSLLVTGLVSLAAKTESKIDDQLAAGVAGLVGGLAVGTAGARPDVGNSPVVEQSKAPNVS